MKGFAFTRRNLVALAAAGVASAGGYAGFASNAFAAGGTLNGAGSTLVAPFEAEWAQGFQSKYHDTVNYSAVGSGTGIADMSNRTVDFGASDAPLTPTQESSCNSCVQIPWAVTATGIGYNVPGVGRNLKLTGGIIANIYLGKVTNWDDPSIQAINKGLHLPNLAITPIYRSDGSGDTYAFTNYLSDVSGTWSSQINYATSVQFPHGVGAKGNSGVVAALQSTQGGITYAAVSYLIANYGHSEYVASVRNAKGNFEFPNLANIRNAARSLRSVPADNAIHIVDPPKSATIAYPISTFTYAIVPQSGNKQASLLKAFINYALTTGQHSGPSLDFAPLPTAVLKAAQKTTSSLS